MDFLLASLLEWAKRQDLASFNLGFSALSGVGGESGDPAIERALHYIYEHMNAFYNFKGVHFFKEKFHPGWSPRYLVYPGPVSLPAVAAGLIRANTGGDLLGGYLFHPR
jgi:phosphatidylglycerol lysyltransferase